MNEREKEKKTKETQRERERGRKREGETKSVTSLMIINFLRIFCHRPYFQSGRRRRKRFISLISADATPQSPAEVCAINNLLLNNSYVTCLTGSGKNIFNHYF